MFNVVFLDKGVVEVPCDNTCLCDKYIKLKEKNQRLKDELDKCAKVYEKDRENKEVIRLLSERILVLESQNRVYAEIIERGKKDDKRA
ncbi:MAG: hypothetical protein J6S85_17150 [Methanobrevibacter sp.]|nr:hypothetical protein [Methanobrevibacter sp.]